jgi:uncharacterized protein YgfB (UPF0149 family)
MKWPCEILHSWCRRFAIGTDGVTEAGRIRQEVRESVHSARNLAQVAVSASRRADRASDETTRVAEDAIRRIESGRGSQQHG